MCSTSRATRHNDLSAALSSRLARHLDSPAPNIGGLRGTRPLDPQGLLRALNEPFHKSRDGLE